MSAGGGNGEDQPVPVVDAGEPTPASPDTAPSAVVDESGLAEVPPSRAQLDGLRRERDELKDALVRRRADFENFKKRSEREQQAAATEAAAAVLRRLVEPLDNLERALAALGGEAALREGVELTLRDFLAALEAHGVTALDPLGQPFDPERHQALLEEPAPGFSAGTVAQVFRKGYLYKDRLLRPALVKVAGAGAEDATTGVDAGGDAEVQ